MHEHWMRICLELAREAMQTGNAPVGAVLVRNGKVIGAGREAGKTNQDITCHAEIEAIRHAISQGYSDFSEATLYTTHEPCIMCSYVIRHHKISKIIMGLAVPEVGGYTSAYPILKATAITRWGPTPEVIFGTLKEECAALNQEFKLRNN
ncbi:tRNA-specific adenosine deaminase [Adhaeribacter aerolatus]|uniref:tRNA-specific adenosine deaminase n=1 Tax=Adhaeribacter aerolatus TaxID=670289 RepID=A0A512AX32_9BACT|nr:nucleoside deaminase [Adhaeribacter aerolatus]GEO04067.1 tRNA-specific adenosine deaminase [Adhaeribacter aerolatus]